MKTAHQVAKWLKSIHRTQSVRPCVVTIGPDTYEGAMYECVGEYHRRIRMQSSEASARRATYTSSVRFTSWATCPRSCRQRRRTCFTFEGQDWYLAAHSNPGIKPADRTPFGPFIIIDPWTCPRQDRRRQRPYQRVPMTVKLDRCV